ncbi:hypothetical protein QPL79_02135 [Ignisphaera sp. 4213-co]|uniref:Transcriptional regulator n=1 Tax=Ignisphaera cupida TaxID=3050454 RepID=A0ABD4Z4W8_9CREN|nr:hypothetical protein [Ignisphaera sp. 4213-co]MDK6028164.1 hypothetical protein [Ignisphaera sp. 4213-co]
MSEKVFGYTEKLTIVKILKALNRFFSLRDLEQVLDVPFQSLWKYVNLIGLPSEEVVESISTKLAKLRIVDEILANEAKKFRSNPYSLSMNMGFLELYALKIAASLKNFDIDVVVSLSQEASTLATLVSNETGADLCIPLPNENLNPELIKVISYYSTASKKMKMLIYPRNCVKEEKKVFLSDLILIDLDKFEAVNALIKSKDSKVFGIATIYISKNALEKLASHDIKIVYHVDVL